MATQTNAPLPAGIEIAGYRIVKKIASGGFSMVYLATDPQNATVVIKEFLPAILVRRDEGELIPRVSAEHLYTYRLGLKCFFEEGRSLAMIVHPNIVRVLNFFRANETVYMVMQYESGKSLQEYLAHLRALKRKRMLPTRHILRIFTEVLHGLAEVHANRMLHLDLKPANVFLRLDGSPILLDFGAARQAVQNSFSNSVPMYTPGFAPPEMYWRDAKLGPWTDVYGIGASIFSSMTGRPPPSADARLKNDELPKLLHDLREQYPEPLLTLVERCMRLRERERLQSVEAVLAEMPEAPPPIAAARRTTLERATAEVERVKHRVTRFMRTHDWI
jgi:serine/threonine protein kinase